MLVTHTNLRPGRVVVASEPASGVTANSRLCDGGHRGLWFCRSVIHPTGRKDGFQTGWQLEKHGFCLSVIVYRIPTDLLAHPLWLRHIWGDSCGFVKSAPGHRDSIRDYHTPCRTTRKRNYPPQISAHFTIWLIRGIETVLPCNNR